MESNALTTSSRELCSALLSLVGEKGCLFDPQETAAYCEDWRQLYKGKTPAVVRPASTEEVAAVVRFCAERRIGGGASRRQHRHDGGCDARMRAARKSSFASPA